ncbi:hypothetical protein BGX21_004632 [Mortierella sp. AD011]|nr:hypothetical protein BGX20_008917 [Mortierella sp. AD010]KAF9400276.1 hypothetical protein BGX21_004632 [Mortierella sp. AD011]
MLSSFKGRFGTGVSTQQEKGHATTSPPSNSTTTIAIAAATAAAARTSSDSTTDDTSGSQTALASPHSPIPSQSSFVSIASRFSGFRRPHPITRSSSDLITSAASGTLTGAGVDVSGVGNSSGSKLVFLVQQLTLDPKDEKADPAELDRIREQQPAGTELSEAMIEKLEILQRYEARFPGENKNRPLYLDPENKMKKKNEDENKRVNKKRTGPETETGRKYLAKAFKKIVQEKLAAEAVLKATTALEDLGDVEALEAHMQNMAHKSEMSMQEIKRLSSELREALNAKEAESARQTALIEDLQSQLALRQEEIERLKSKKDPSFVGSSDTTSIYELERHSDIETKVNSLDLAIAPQFRSTPSPPLVPSDISPPPVPSDISPPTVSAIPTSSGSSTKKKRSKDPEKKDQALRELMIRLESVLKEKNQAQEEQEEVVEQMNQLRIQLEKELKANKDMAEKMDQLQTTVAIMEDRLRREAVSRDMEYDRPNPRAPLTEACRSSEDSEVSAKIDDSLILQEDLLAARHELETVLKRESEVKRTKEEIETTLTTIQKAHDDLQESLSQTKQKLEAANAQITVVQELSTEIGEIKQELVEAQEEIKERQQLLNLERQWREEAEKNRDELKRQQELLITPLKQDLAKATARQQELEQELEQAVAKAETKTSCDREGQLEETIRSLEQRLSAATKEREILERNLAENSNASEKPSSQFEEQSRLIESLRLEKNELSASAVEHRNLIESLQVEKESSAKALKDLQDKESIAVAKIQELEAQIAELKQQRVNHSSSDSDANSLEQLSSLKQERAELSEKLARLERLHQGFELSSSERIQALEKELEILVQQKVVLEAQVQEQSDLLIKEKEKEKELEQARVAEGIERVRIELAAVRTAERFASEKVTELAKERDMVAEKVVKLEQRLETLKECKVGQEQNLTGKIEELTREKQDLESQMQSLRSDLESLKVQSDDEKQTLKVKYDALKEESNIAIARISELEVELGAAKDKSDDGSKVQAFEEELSTLKSELQAKIKQLEIAQEQTQVQQALHADKAIQLSNQIQELTAERDSLLQSKLELEMQLRDASEQAEALRQKLKVMEEDNERLMNAKTEAQEKMGELNSRIAAQGLKERDHKEALALAKDTIHQRDEELSSTRKLLQKAESNLEKSVQKVLKLEKEVQTLVDKLQAAKTNLSKVQQENKTAVAKSNSQQSATSQELERLKAKHAKVLQERDQVIEERDKLLQGKDANQKELQMKQAELEALQKTHETSEAQMREYQTQLTESRNRVDTLEELTSIAKLVAESKVVEFESLKAKSDELEKQLSSAKELVRKNQDDYQETVNKLKEDIEDTREALGEEISGLMAQIEQRNEELERIKASEAQNKSDAAEATIKLERHMKETQEMETEVLELRERNRNLGLELKHFSDLEEILAKEKAARETAAEEFKMREGHLRTVNKTLKEEVRKLQKHLPGSSPLPSPSSPAFPQTPGVNGQQSQYHTTPATPKPNTNTISRAYSTPVLNLNLTPPATPRFQRQQPPMDEDVNVEYLKNVLLNFLEHKERRQQLIPVVAQILRLSSDETKRFSRVA